MYALPERLDSLSYEEIPLYGAVDFSDKIYMLTLPTPAFLSVWEIRVNHVIFFFLFVVNFVIHWNKTAMGLHVFPIPIPRFFFFFTFIGLE